MAIGLMLIFGLGTAKRMNVKKAETDTDNTGDRLSVIPN